MCGLASSRLSLVLSGTGLSGQQVGLTESTCKGDSLCPELLSFQAWRWLQVLLKAVLFPFAPASYCCDCSLVTCLAQLLFCLLREINPISLISTGQERKAGWRLNSFGDNDCQNGDWGRRDTPGAFLEDLKGFCGKLIGLSWSQNQRSERHSSWLPSLLYCKLGDGALGGILSCSLPSDFFCFPSQT